MPEIDPSQQNPECNEDQVESDNSEAMLPPPIIDPLLANDRLSTPFDVEMEFRIVNKQGMPQVCYALAHNRIPILESLKIQVVDSSAPQKLSIKINGEWAVNDRSPIKENELVIDAPLPGAAVELSPVEQVQLNDIALADLEELAPAVLILEISDDLGRKQIVRQDIDVYARDQWLSNLKAAVLTSAFVQPNHPDITKIMSHASQILKRLGAHGLSGYQQQDDGHHHRIAEAIFLALQDFVTTYINPPASYESLGQKLRPIDRVLEEKQGTCIDLACAYASCLEQAGLHPIIFLVKGHAFTGYITDGSLNDRGQLNHSVIHSWEAIQSYLDSGLIVGVETVCITNGASFETAKQAIQPYLNSQLMEAIVDVAMAHREGIRPLPARILRDNVITVVIDNGPSTPPVIERRDPTTRKLLPESVPARVQSWKNALLDLSFRNRLLNMRPDRHGIRLLPPVGQLGWVEDHLNNGEIIEVIAANALNAVDAQLVQRGGDLPLDQLIQKLHRSNSIYAGIDIDRFKTSVSRLRSDARLQEEESGANCLYLTLGSVKWSSHYGEYVSPLFLVPIRIKSLRGVNAVVLEMDATQSTTVNYCLIEALRFREQLRLQWFSDDMSDDLGLDVEAGLEALRKEFRENGLDIKGFSVDQTASIAVLDFKKFRLWKDLNDHWKDFMKSPVVKHLVETPRETFRDPADGKVDALKIDDTTTICVQPADGSQIAAIERALVGSSFVLQGPPGSGKSQTITNLLANAMYRGKTVLFVAEKQAALQEVQERLEAVNLGPYCLVLHDSGTKPEDLRAQLRDALDQRPQLDERLHDQFEDDFAVAAKQLDNYRRNVHSPNNAGFSFYKAYLRLNDLGDGPIVGVPREFLNIDLERVASLQRGLLGLDDFTRPANVQKQHPWSLCGVIAFDTIDRIALTNEIRLAIEACSGLHSIDSDAVVNALKHATTLDLLMVVADVLDLREKGQLPVSTEWSQIIDSNWQNTVESSLIEYELALKASASDVAGHEEILRRSDLDQSVSLIKEAAGSFALGRKKRVRQALGPFTSVFGPSIDNPEQVVSVVERVAATSRKVREIHEKLLAVGGLRPHLPEVLVHVSDVEAVRITAGRLSQVASHISQQNEVGAAIRSLAADNEFPTPGLAQSVRTTVGAIESVASRLGSDQTTIQRWAQGRGLIDAVAIHSRDVWQESVNSGTFLSLQRWLNLTQMLLPYREAGLDQMCLDIEDGVLAAEDVPAAFERGILMTTLQVRAEETDLDVFDSTQQNRRVRHFVDVLNERRERAQKVIPYFLFKSRTINADVNTGKVGEFRREVNTPTRRRRGRSIRHLIEKYPEIISDLTPCFLMSPDSVAQFVPPGSLNFDVVVFDEASQIVVADAIGVMGRSQSSVIVGDSKQMPPTKFGVVDVSSDDEFAIEEDSVSEDEESILEEAVAAGFHQEMLTWHYRSQDESLIAFSNEHYYDRRLSTFPAPVDFRPDCGVFYRRVDGQFDHGRTRTNKIEAEAIVEELVKRLDDSATADLSYGIVTLNIQQRNLITELIDQHTHPKIRELRETEDKKHRLFVLNLENVQGRERDVIIFGTSFSKRVGGGAMPLNFGPLTQKGGEKRLNVAVTRAKRQFVVVSSFDPEDMETAKTLGMMHLREYLKSARRRAAQERLPHELTSSNAQQIKRVADRLRERGLVVETGVGLSNFKIDLALTVPEMPNTWLVAVLFDGDGWSNRSLATDRDALPMMVLENIMRWRRVARVWTPSLRLEFDAVIDELVEHVHIAKDLPEPVVQTPIRTHKDSAALSEDETGSAAGDSSSETRNAMSRDMGNQVVALRNEVPFTEHEVPTQYVDLQFLGTRHSLPLLENLVDDEGPMPAVEALKRVARAYGLQRVTNDRLRQLTQLLSTRMVTEVDDELYVWPANVDPLTWRDVRKTSGNLRKIDLISPYEIANAMEEIVRQSISMSKDELLRWTAQYFGPQKLSAKLNEYLSMCVSFAISEGRLTDADGYLTASKDRFSSE